MLNVMLLFLKFVGLLVLYCILINLDVVSGGIGFLLWMIGKEGRICLVLLCKDNIGKLVVL